MKYSVAADGTLTEVALFWSISQLSRLATLMVAFDHKGAVQLGGRLPSMPGHLIASVRESATDRPRRERPTAESSKVVPSGAAARPHGWVQARCRATAVRKIATATRLIATGTS